MNIPSEYNGSIVINTNDSDGEPVTVTTDDVRRMFETGDWDGIGDIIAYSDDAGSVIIDICDYVLQFAFGVQHWPDTVKDMLGSPSVNAYYDAIQRDETFSQATESMVEAYADAVEYTSGLASALGTGLSEPVESDMVIMYK